MHIFYIIFSFLPRRLRKYIGPHDYCNWPDKQAKNNIQKNIVVIQQKADQIYNKFKSYFAYKDNTAKTFWEVFDQEVDEFKTKTKDMEESKVLSLVKDPTRPVSNLNPMSDDEDV